MSSRSGRTPTPICQSSTKPGRNTPDCSKQRNDELVRTATKFAVASSVRTTQVLDATYKFAASGRTDSSFTRLYKKHFLTKRCRYCRRIRRSAHGRVCHRSSSNTWLPWRPPWIFKIMSTAGPVTLTELTARTHLDERYLREWLAALVSAGYIQFEPSTAKYVLPPEHATVLVDESSPFFMGGMLQLLVPMHSMAPRVAEAFRTGKGAPLDEYPPDMFEG